MVHGARVTTDRTRLAQAVLSRRNELGMKTQTALAEAADVSRASVNTVETGKKVSPNVLSRIELALQWAPGSASAILEGGDPLPRGRGAVEMSATGALTVGDTPGAARAAGTIDVRKASTEELAALFMDMAKDHSDAELLDVMAQVMKLRSQENASREVG